LFLRFGAVLASLGLFQAGFGACDGLKYFVNQVADSPKIEKNNGFAIRGRPKQLVRRGGY
jgi:hypothetical protein